MNQQDDSDLLYARIRTRLVFEHLVTSVLFGALISASVYLLAFVSIDLITLKFGFATLFSAIFYAVYFAFIVFLTGFLSAIVVGIPLFELLEKRKLRKAWPYFVAAVIVEVSFFALVTGKAPIIADLPLLTTVTVLAPGIIIITLFTRRMLPVWRQAEKAEQASTAIVVRLN